MANNAEAVGTRSCATAFFGPPPTHRRDLHDSSRMDCRGYRLGA